MKYLYLDCSMGAAGDMLAAALLELCEDKDSMLALFNHLDLPGVEVTAAADSKCGVSGTHLSVCISGTEEDEHLHEHSHAAETEATPHRHDHGHTHGCLHDIEHMVEHMPVSEKVKHDIMAVYDLIAAAESAVHGRPVEEIHFHEVGTMDAVCDVAMVCLLMEHLAPDRVTASPVHVGSGTVRCAHGILPVPAPAAAKLLEGIPIYGGSIQSELCTPTGAALLKYFVSDFGSMPVMVPEKTGYGTGKKDFERANVLRAVLGHDYTSQTDGKDMICQLSCNLDDMTPENIGFAMERLFEAGAVDVYTQPVGMKKNRPGVLLTALVKPEKREAVVSAMFRHTTTIGIRESRMERYVLRRTEESRETAFGTIRFKRAEGYGTVRVKPEYDDLAAAARASGKSLREVREELEH